MVDKLKLTGIHENHIYIHRIQRRKRGQKISYPKKNAGQRGPSACYYYAVSKQIKMEKLQSIELRDILTYKQQTGRDQRDFTRCTLYLLYTIDLLAVGYT